MAATLAPARPDVAAELDRLLAGGLIRSVYQPIVDLETREPVGFEALARGPEGSLLERPDRLFAAAHECGRVDEVEWACRAAAVRGALAAGLRRPFSLFVNVEPSMLGRPFPDDLRELFDAARGEMDLVLELTERAVTDRPADLLHRLPQLRALGCSIALDDVGAEPGSLALMPFVRPEVIKLDLRLVQQHPDRRVAAIVHAVNAEAERSGAVLLAEGIETEEQLEVALALGARYGQGWLFGRPGPLRPSAAPARPLVVPGGADACGSATPFEVVAGAGLPVRRGRKPLLLAISRHLEEQAEDHGESAVVLSTFQEARHLTPRTAERYERLAARTAFVGALGVGLDVEPVPGVRGVALEDAEPLRGEWHVVVIGPHFAAAFVGRDLGDAGADADRRFDFCLTYDRDLAVRAGRAMLARVAPV